MNRVSEIFSRLKAPLGYPGWVMVLICFAVVGIGFGSSTATMPLIYGSVMEEFGWTRTQTTFIYTYKNIASAGMSLFFVGPLIVRFGLRPVMIGSFIATGTGMAAFLWVQSLWSFYLSGFVLGLGVATILVGAQVLVSRWFIRRQGFAVGLTLAGGSVGGIIFAVLGEWLIQAIGWRAAFAGLSIGIWALVIPIYMLFAREKPTSEELRAEALEDQADLAPETPQTEGEQHMRLRKVLQLPSFWTVLTCIFFIALMDSGIFQHSALFLEREAGLESSTVAYCISAMFGLSILGKVVAGRNFDRWSLKGVGFWYMLSGLAIVAALSIQGGLTLALFVLLRGISHGGVVTGGPVIAKHCYGPQLVSLTLPVMAGVWSVGAAIGPVTLAIFYDTLGSYDLVFTLAAILALIAAFLMYRLRPFHRESLRVGKPAEETAAEPAGAPTAFNRY